ncbi:PREDICTED: uncharacterized protein LOC104587461 [Nelumbo nucifera]|uniref:Uncharacterized protein LOC104587461 n=2 Tax=Nelumbo nucifera TaxID=4432 RepID=A0A1U7YYZ8_NELNU|nr:PREDICTED: uncharacterized protein LOC104587461 [Nelumbo nucifera]DAD30057.1 TPA_asm: hypothetical protein HUJ06_031525 [Nelumbo nucifera]
MASLYSPSSILHPPLLPSSHPRLQFRRRNQLSLPFSSSQNSLRSFGVPRSSPEIPTPSTEAPISIITFEDIVEKDWSFLETDETNSDEQRTRKTDRIISAGQINGDSRVLVSIATEEFVDRLVESSPSCRLMLFVHDSLFVLAGIKEKHDSVKCWQGELINVPEKWTPFDVVFLCYLPALPFELDKIFASLSRHCSPGARLVISYSQGREVVEKQRQQYSDVVISDLPDRLTLEKVAANHSFEIAEFEDEPGFYFAVLKFCREGTPAE